MNWARYPERTSGVRRRPSAIAVLVAVLLCVGVALAAEVNYAALLSRETIGFVQVRRVDRLLKRAGELGPLSKTLQGLGVPAKETANVARVLRGLRSTNWSFHVPAMGGRDRTVDVLVIADLDDPKFLLGLMRDGARLKELRFPPGSKPPVFDADDLGRNNGFVWAQPELGKLVVSTDPALVYGVAEALRKGRADSLATDPAYKAVGLPHARRDIQGYGSVPELVRLIVADGSYVSRREAAQAAFLMGLVGSSAVSYGQDFDGSRAEALAGPVPDASVLRCLGGPLRGAKMMPHDAIVGAAVSVRDGTRLWTMLRGGIKRFAGAYKPRDAGEFERDLARGESELGFRVDEAAELVKGVGVFVGDGWGAGFIFVRDAEKARGLLRRTLPRGRRRLAVAGEEAFWAGRKSDGFAYLQRGDCVLIAPKVEWLRRAASGAPKGAPLQVGGDGVLFASLRPRKIPKPLLDDDLYPLLDGLGETVTLTLSLDGRLLKARLTGAPDPVRMAASVIELQRKRRRPVPRAKRVVPMRPRRRAHHRIPEHVLNRRSPYILAEPPWTVEWIRYRDWIKLPVDAATSYRMRNGKKWSGKLVCATCKRPIPIWPRRKMSPAERRMTTPEDDMPKPYKCPRCGKEANAAVLEERKALGR